MKPQTFEEYMQEIHAKYYIGSGSNILEDFERWLENQDIEDWLHYGQQYGNKKGDNGNNPNKT